MRKVALSTWKVKYLGTGGRGKLECLTVESSRRLEGNDEGFWFVPREALESRTNSMESEQVCVQCLLSRVEEKIHKWN